MSTSEIIATKLPLGMETASNFYRRETGIRTGIEQEFIQAQREAILRFCEEVAAQQLRFLESGMFAVMNQCSPEYSQAAAFQLVRDAFMAGISPQTEPSQKPDPSRSDY